MSYIFNKYLWCVDPLRKSDGSEVSSLFEVNKRQHIPVCAKAVSSWVRKILSTAKVHMSLDTL